MPSYREVGPSVKNDTKMGEIPSHSLVINMAINVYTTVAGGATTQ